MKPVILVMMLAACHEESLAPRDLDGVKWAGRFEGVGCASGEVELELVASSPDWFEGTYTYSAPEGIAAYAVEGPLERGVPLELDQVDLDGGPLPEGWQWCLGSFSLGLDRLGGSLFGDWRSETCGCGGSVELTGS